MRRRRAGRTRPRLASRPLCDQESTTWAARSGPTPGWSSSCGASLRVSVSISRASSRSSTVSCCTRRATARSASRLPRSSGSRAALGPHRCEAVRAAAPGSAKRSSARSGSGVVTSSARSWQSPARFAIAAPSRAAINARSASRSPLLRGVAGRFCASTLRAARIASSASVFPPERRSRAKPADLEHLLAAADAGSGSGRHRRSRCPRPRTHAGQAHAAPPAASASA